MISATNKQSRLNDRGFEGHRLFELLRSNIQVSFEFFPPNTPEMTTTLWKVVRRLEPLAPRFVSVTYGAGGSTRERTHDLVSRILNETELTPAAHLTCIGASRDEIDEIARGYWEAGVRHIVALRGDPPANTKQYQPHPNGYAYASGLVRGLRRIADFEISVAAYPETHPEAPSPELDLDNLKRKIDAGATRAITQYFFDPRIYLRFRDKARAAGITVPIVPGLLPVTNVRQLKRFSAMCGATVPGWLTHLFEGLDDNPDIRNLVAASVVAEQCRELVPEGVDEIHFYTLNRAELSYAICHILGLRPRANSL
ncbi:MAG: methylenetetrahydrofolate reductase [Sphingomonadales bacterium]